MTAAVDDLAPDHGSCTPSTLTTYEALLRSNPIHIATVLGQKVGSFGQHSCFCEQRKATYFRIKKGKYFFLLNEWELIKQRASYSAFQSIYFQALHVVICSFGERYSENSFLGRSKDAPGVAPALAGQAAPPQQKSLRFLAVDGYGRREVLETPGDRKTGMPTQTKIRM